MNKPQLFSARALLGNAPESPSILNPEAPNLMKTTRHSLVGFDPLLGSTPVRSAPMECPPPPQPFSSTKAPLAQVAAPVQPRTHESSWVQHKSKHEEKYRHGKSLFSSSVRGVAHKVLEDEERTEKRISCPERLLRSDEIEPRASPAQKNDAKEKNHLTTKESSILPTPYKTSAVRKELFTISIPSRKEISRSPSSPKEPDFEDSNTGELPKEPMSASGIIRKLPWSRSKVEQNSRPQSAIESSEVTTLREESKQEPPRRASMHGTSEVEPEMKTSMYNSLVKDLMDLRVDKLLLPTLAKPMPTSFLTGHEDEVMRTCEYAAAPFQMEIPPVSALVIPARLNEFVENYRRIDQNFEPNEWKGLNSMDLRKITLVQHIPIAHLLLECGDEISIQGTISVGSDADNRLEAVFFEGQRNFVVVIRGTTEQQSKPCPAKTTNRKPVPLGTEHEHVEIYQCFMDEYQKIEQKCFALLDKLTEEHPFCDVVFTGHSFGAALATLAAVRYANARPMMRVKCYPMASPKVGFSEFRRMVNSSPNLQMMRVEYGQDGKCQLPSQGGSHVGHTLVLHGSLGRNSHKTKEPVQAYKFEAPKHRKFQSIHPDLRSYVVALEEISLLGLRWPTDYVGTTGEGVVVNNESRQMV